MFRHGACELRRRSIVLPYFAIDCSLVVGFAVLIKVGGDTVSRAVQWCSGATGNVPWESCGVDAMAGVLGACWEALHNGPAMKVDETKTAPIRLRSSIMLLEVAARRLKQTAARRPEGNNKEKILCVCKEDFTSHFACTRNQRVYA